MDFIQGIKHLKIDPSGIDISGSGHVVLNADGHVGIGISNPTYPLEVVAAHTATDVNNMYYINATTAAQNAGDEWQLNQTGNNKEVNIRANNWIRANEGYLVDSDRRIKRDIDVVPDNFALFQVNNVETKYYHYVDPFRKNKQKTVGFIAQEVREQIPSAVELLTDFVPDEMRKIDNPVWEQDGDKWRLVINDLVFGENHTKRCRFCLGNTNAFTDVAVEADNKSFILEKKTDEVFLFGKEVNDFHSLDKNVIFALHHSAIQELSRKNDAKDALITSLQEEIKNKADLITSFESRMAALETAIVGLQNK